MTNFCMGVSKTCARATSPMPVLLPVVHAVASASARRVACAVVLHDAKP